MPVQAAPLLHYYSFLNAAKALLVAKGVPFDEHHGVRAHNMRVASKAIALSNEGVRILTKGVLPALAAYLGDTEPNTIHSLKELLFNLPFVHRTYCLTYQAQSDLFYALTDCVYVFDSNARVAYLQANLSRDFAAKRYVKKLPPELVADPSRSDDVRAIRSAASATVASRQLRSAADIARLQQLHHGVRRVVQCITAPQTLWYAKAMVAGPRRLSRSPLTITLAAMHRLSELCRYRPLELESFLAGQKNWLITEFVLMSPEQYLDGIAAELTGHQFMRPNIRPAS